MRSWWVVEKEWCSAVPDVFLIHTSSNSSSGPIPQPCSLITDSGLVALYIQKCPLPSDDLNSFINEKHFI